MCTRLYSQEEQKTIRDFKYRSKNQCAYCGKTLLDKDMTVDHKIPYSRGGETVLENLVISCSSCNTDKSDMTGEEYINYLILKEEEIGKDETLGAIKKIIDFNNNTENRYKEITIALCNKGTEIKEIEDCIKTMLFNASQGYNLCKELKDTLNVKESMRKESNKLLKLKNAVQAYNEELKTTYNDLSYGVVKELRVRMNIGQLAKI